LNQFRLQTGFHEYYPINAALFFPPLLARSSGSAGAKSSQEMLASWLGFLAFFAFFAGALGLLSIGQDARSKCGRHMLYTGSLSCLPVGGSGNGGGNGVVRKRNGNGYMDRDLRNISPRFICTIILHAYPVSGFSN